MNTIHISKAGQGEHFLLGADVITIRAAGTETSGRQLVLEVIVPPGGGPPMLHRHEYVETFHFLEGTFEISTTDETHGLQTSIVNMGDIVSIPSLVWHNFKNVGATPGRFTVVHSPTVMEALIRKIGVPVEDPLNPATPAGPPSAEQMQQMMAEIGKYMEMLPDGAVTR